jgi:hypothetical protein
MPSFTEKEISFIELPLQGLKPTHFLVIGAAEAAP